MYVDWKHGLRVDVSAGENKFNKFLIFVGENGIPFNAWGIGNGCFWTMTEKFYIEYDVKLYECDQESCEVILRDEIKFDPTNKNFYFELFPRSQNELDIWMEYLSNFIKIKKCTIYIKKIENFEINIQNDKIFVVDELGDLEYYAKYKICWDDDYNYNPIKTENLDSYSLINNCLLRL